MSVMSPKVREKLESIFMEGRLKYVRAPTIYNTVHRNESKLKIVNIKESKSL